MLLSIGKFIIYLVFSIIGWYCVIVGIDYIDKNAAPGYLIVAIFTFLLSFVTVVNFIGYVLEAIKYLKRRVKIIAFKDIYHRFYIRRNKRGFSVAFFKMCIRVEYKKQ